MPGVRGGAAGGARGAGVQPGTHRVRRVLDPGPRLLPRLVPRAREGGARQVQLFNCEIHVDTSIFTTVSPFFKVVTSF